MRINTTRFGSLELEENKVIVFPKGIPGIESIKRYTIVPVAETADLNWLQALDDPAVAFIIIDPFKYFQGYSCDIPEHELKELGLEETQAPLLLSIVTIPPGKPLEATANLVAPIVINTKTNRAKQIILNNSPFTTKHRLFPEVNTPAPADKNKQKSCKGGL